MSLRSTEPPETPSPPRYSIVLSKRSFHLRGGRRSQLPCPLPSNSKHQHIYDMRYRLAPHRICFSASGYLISPTSSAIIFRCRPRSKLRSILLKIGSSVISHQSTPDEITPKTRVFSTNHRRSSSYISHAALTLLRTMGAGGSFAAAWHDDAFFCHACSVRFTVSLINCF